MKNLLLFYAGDGHAGNNRVGIIMEDHAQPIAFWPKSWGAKGTAGYDPDGLLACWESLCDVEDFFAAIGVGQAPAPGLWVLELESGKANDDDDDWSHLSAYTRMHLRRPVPDELARIGEGLPPWDGGSWA